MDGLVFDGGVDCDCGVAPMTVVEDLKALEDRVRKIDTGPPSLPVQEFDLHPGGSSS